MSYNKNYKEPLKKGETNLLTIGCRHSNPDICRKNGQDDVCALVRKDNICTSPPRTWAKLFEELNKQK
jgi:hypothetical protein